MIFLRGAWFIYLRGLTAQAQLFFQQAEEKSACLKLI